MVLLDHMNFVFMNFHSVRAVMKKQQGKEEFFEEDLPFFFHFYLNNLINIHKTYGRIIICKEGIKSTAWRKSIFSGYKENRKVAKADDGYKVIISAMSKVDELLSFFPNKIIEFEHAEADDIIHTLTKKYAKTEPVLILSSDKDLVQLINFYGKDVSVYNLSRKYFIKPDKYILERKAIVGDSSDGIPGVPRIGEKTFEKIINDPSEFHKKIKNGNREVYKTFLKIIDLREFPEEWQTAIELTEDTTEWNILNKEEIELFLFENNLIDLMGRWNSVAGEIRMKLNENETRG